MTIERFKDIYFGEILTKEAMNDLYLLIEAERTSAANEAVEEYKLKQLGHDEEDE